jgi:hypothetical protein
MATFLEEYTTEEQLWYVCFWRAKELNAKESIKKCCLFILGSVCRLKRFHLSDKSFPDDGEVEMDVRKWLRRQSKDFYAAGFDALVKRWDKCKRNNVFFFSRYQYHMLHVLYPFVPYLLALLRIFRILFRLISMQYDPQHHTVN